jgi:hypothetical protein
VFGLAVVAGSPFLRVLTGESMFLTTLRSLAWRLRASEHYFTGEYA